MAADPVVPTPSLKDAFAAASIRSPLLEWMIKNYPEIKASKDSGPKRWAPLSAYLLQIGLCEADGRAYSSAKLATTWWSACRAVERANRTQTTISRGKAVLPARGRPGQALVRSAAEPVEQPLLSDEEVQAKLARVQGDLERVSVKFPSPLKSEK